MINVVLRDWAAEAKHGKASDFRSWTFFETNCLSELINLARRGSERAVHSFLRGRDILLPATVLSELAAAPDIAAAAAAALEGGRVFLVPDMSRFFQCDLWNFINVEGHPRNVLDAKPMPEGVLSSIGTHQPFLDAVATSRAAVESEYVKRVSPDVGAGLDERELLAIIWSRINALGTEWLNLEIPTADARPDRFPAFFTFYYAYFFRYMKTHTVKVHVNDFNDITNTLAAPYCCDFFTEKTLAGVLRNEVQGRVPPRPIETARRLARKGVLEHESLRRAEAAEAQRSSNAGLLEMTRIWTINDLREQVAASA